MRRGGGGGGCVWYPIGSSDCYVGKEEGGGRSVCGGTLSQQVFYRKAKASQWWKESYASLS